MLRYRHDGHIYNSRTNNMARTLITEEQEEEVVRLYRSQKYKIKDIMKMSGVRSEQTIYRILDGADVPRLKSKAPARKLSVTIDDEILTLIEQDNPINLSKWICEKIKEGYRHKTIPQNDTTNTDTNDTTK